MQGGIVTDPPTKPKAAPTALEQRGTRFEFGAPVTGAVTAGEAVAVAFGDGMVRFFSPGAAPREVKAHSGVVLCISADGAHVVTGGDDGRCLRISLDGEIQELGSFGTRWVDCVAASHGHRHLSVPRAIAQDSVSLPAAGLPVGQHGAVVALQDGLRQSGVSVEVT